MIRNNIINKKNIFIINLNLYIFLQAIKNEKLALTPLMNQGRFFFRIGTAGII